MTTDEERASIGLDQDRIAFFAARVVEMNRIKSAVHCEGENGDREDFASYAGHVVMLRAQLADAKAAQAMVLERAAAVAKRHRSKVQINEPLWHDGQDWASDRIAKAIEALADTDGLSLVQSLRAERDDALNRMSKLQSRLLSDSEKVMEWSADRDRLSAANAALEAQVARLVGARPTLNWRRAEGQTIHEMRVNLQSSPFGQALINMGDCALVWANEGDLYQFYAALAEVQADARQEGGE